MQPTTIDDTIKNLLKIVSGKKDELKKIVSLTKSSWKTNCSYVLPVDNRVEIKNIATMSELNVIDMVTDIIHRTANRQSAILELGLSSDYEYLNNIQGYSKDDWIADAKKRIAVLNFNNKKKELDDLEVKLNSLISPEERRQIELEEIALKIKNL